MITAYTITLTVACCVAVALVIGAERRGRSAESRGVPASTFAILAASCATLSTLSYAMAGPEDENLVPLVIGDVTMPLCTGLLLAAMRRAAGRKHSLAGLCLLISILVGATTVLVSPEAGQAVKLLALALFTGATAVTCLREPLPALGAWLVGMTSAVYSAYCLLRFGVPLLLGSDDVYVQATLGREPSTIVAALAVAVIAWGTIVVIRRPATGQPSSIVTVEALSNWIGALLAQRSEVPAIAISVPALPLHRAAFGRAWGLSISGAVRAAVQETMPASSVIGRVAPDVLVALQFGAAVDLGSVRTRLQESYERMLPHPAPTEPPDLEVQLLSLRSVADLRRFARHARTAARRAMTSQGV